MYGENKKDKIDYEPLIPSSRPPGYAKKLKEGVPKSAKQVLPIGIFVVTILGCNYMVGSRLGGFSNCNRRNGTWYRTCTKRNYGELFCIYHDKERQGYQRR